MSLLKLEALAMSLNVKAQLRNQADVEPWSLGGELVMSVPRNCEQELPFTRNPNQLLQHHRNKVARIGVGAEGGFVL